jgi:cbb3-type cytochrome oxidase maturation protein
MSVLFVVLPLAILFSGLAVTAFLWSTRSGQLDDLETPPLRILGDDTKLRSSHVQSSRESPRTNASSARSSTRSASMTVKIPTTLP